MCLEALGEGFPCFPGRRDTVDQVILEESVTWRKKNWRHAFLFAIGFLLMKQ